MSDIFFYRTYSRLYKRNSLLRQKLTPLGVIVVIVCIISALTGLNIFSSGLYRIFTLSLSLIVVSYLMRTKKVSHIEIKAFFDKKYEAGKRSEISIRIYNLSDSDIHDIDILPETEKFIPDKNEFLNIKEPGEEKRNFWDRNVYYFRWLWHILKKYKVEFEAFNIKKIKKDSHITINYIFLPVQRGKVNFKGFNILQKDVLGLFYTKKFIEQKDKIIIMPKEVKFDTRLKNSIKILNERMKRGRNSLSLKHKAGDFVGIRDYVPGDPYKNIHWKTWAKTGKPAVIEKGVEKIREFCILLINVKNDSNDDDFLLFEDILSSLFSTLKYLESSDYRTEFVYFNRFGQLQSFVADHDTGNYTELYSLLPEIKCIQKKITDTRNALRPKISSYGPTIVYAVKFFRELKEMFREKNIITVVSKAADHRSDNSIPVARINDKITEINLP
ncbi:MAG: DUF58 domain-containing protein [Candidatus Delongbacteria bacterium]